MLKCFIFYCPLLEHGELPCREVRLQILHLEQPFSLMQQQTSSPFFHLNAQWFQISECIFSDFPCPLSTTPPKQMELGRICWDFLYLLLPKMYNFIKKDYHEAAHGSFLHASCIPSNNCSVSDTTFHWQHFLNCHLRAERTLLKHYLSPVQSNSTHNMVVSVYLIILLATTTEYQLFQIL